MVVQQTEIHPRLEWDTGEACPKADRAKGACCRTHRPNGRGGQISETYISTKGKEVHQKVLHPVKVRCRHVAVATKVSVHSCWSEGPETLLLDTTVMSAQSDRVDSIMSYL